MKKIRQIQVAIFDGTKLFPEIRLITDDLQVYYDIIGCHTIDITTFNGLDVVCDDEGLLKDSTQMTASYISGANSLQRLTSGLFGTLVFTRHNDEGELTSLNSIDIENLVTRFPRGSYYNSSGEERFILLSYEG